MHRWFILLLLAWSSSTAVAQLQSPDEFLGYTLGDRFTPHHKVEAYIYHVAEYSKRVTLQRIGHSYEQRGLYLLTISTPENLANKETIRKSNLKSVGFEQQGAENEQVAIVWLSYNVHGNEASSSEAALRTLHALADESNTQTGAWLSNTIVLMDPMLNPDGRDRYVHWYHQVVGKRVNSSPFVREHVQPWPGGRTNHYYFDMNRDWAWQTQVESQARIAVYHEWMPHVHVDFHEQGYNSPYYFAPAANPIHAYITGWQRRFQTDIGKNHTRYFDKEHWLYFTRESFDLFYPSYGDSWPTFNGAIGMTYEQAGINAGLAVTTNNGGELTLADRILHHHTTGLSTIEIASKQAAQLVKEFNAYFKRAQENPSGTYKAFIIRPDAAHAGRLKAFLSLLDAQHIRYGQGASLKSVRVYDYQSQSEKTIAVQADDIIISAYQPKSVLAQVLLEPKAALIDSLTYDITAWSLPYAYGLQAFATSTRIDPKPYSISPSSAQKVEDAYAWLHGWNSVEDAKVLAALVQADVVVRVLNVPSVFNGKTWKEGTLVIAKADQSNPEHTKNTIQQIADRFGTTFSASATGWSDSGVDVGSNRLSVVKNATVAMVSGDKTSSNELGELWYYFDQVLDYPVHLIDAGTLQSMDLSRIDVLVLPSGSYASGAEAFGDRLAEWVRQGGKVIAYNGGVQQLSAFKAFTGPKRVDVKRDSVQLDVAYGNRARHELSRQTSGSIMQVTVDDSHPLGYGLGRTYYALKLNANVYQASNGIWPSGVVRNGKPVSGFMGYKLQAVSKNHLSFGAQSFGRGQVVYLTDAPLFRAFWYQGRHLMANAIFF